MTSRESITFARSVLLSCIACCLSMTETRAADIFTNGPVDGTINGSIISGTSKVSNSFVLNENVMLNAIVGIGLWTDQGDTPVSVTWSIGTAPFGDDLHFEANAALTSSYVTTNFHGFDIRSGSLNLGERFLPAGSYWLTLSNAVSPVNVVGWDWSSGLSTAFQRLGDGTTIDLERSQSFTLRGSSITPVPEPSTVTLVVVSMLAFGGILARRHRGLRCLRV